MKMLESYKPFLLTLICIIGVFSVSAFPSSAFRSSKSAGAYEKYQEWFKGWIERFEALTEYHQQANHQARLLLSDERLLKSLNRDISKELEETWAKAVNEGLHVLEGKMKKVTSYKYPESGSVSFSDVEAAIDALDITRKTIDILDNTTGQSLSLLYEGIRNAFYKMSENRTRQQTIFSIINNIHAIEERETRFLEKVKFLHSSESIDRRAYYRNLRDILEEEKGYITKIDAKNVIEFGQKMKHDVFILSHETKDGRKYIDLFDGFPFSYSPTVDQEGVEYSDEEEIWGVPKGYVGVELRTLKGDLPKGTYELKAEIPGHVSELVAGDNLYIPLWPDGEYGCYGVAGNNIRWRLKCVQFDPKTGPELLRLCIYLGAEQVRSADLGMSETKLVTGDYLINLGSYINRLLESRLELLKKSIFSVGWAPKLEQEVTIGRVGKLQVEVWNTSEREIPDLWLGMDINDLRTEKTVETTRTLRPSTKTPGIKGNIIFDGQMKVLEFGQRHLRTFTCDYRFDKSSTGHEYAPGQYKVWYCVWLGPPGDGLQLIEPQEKLLTLKPGPEITAFPEKPDIRIIQFSQEPYPVELDRKVALVFTVQNQSDVALESGHFEWLILNEGGELMTNLERRAVAMAPGESERFIEPIKLTSKGNGGKYTPGTYQVVFLAGIPSSDLPDAELGVGHKSDLTFQVLVSREQIANNIRKWIEVIEEDERQALPRIKREEQLRAEERRKEEELEQKIAEHYQKLNEEEDARVRRELEEARDRLTRELLAMVYESQQRRMAVATMPPPVGPPGRDRSSTIPQRSTDMGSSDGLLTVKMWTVPSQLSASEFWRRGSMNVTLFYAADKDCDVEIYSQLDSGCFGSFTGARLIETVRGEGGSWVSVYSSPGGGGVRWSRHPPTRIVVQHVRAGRTYTQSLGNVVLPPAVDRYVRSGLSKPQARSERLQVKCSTTLTIKASDGRRTISDSITFKVVP